jgi:hypothetical protein
MKHFLNLFIFFLLITPASVKGQDLYETEDKLQTLFTHLVHYSDDKMRIGANDSIRSIIDEYVMMDTVFNHRFQSLRFLGQITSPDSLMKIVTWNMLLENGTGRYFCYFIRKNSNGKNLVCYLDAPYTEKEIRVDTTYLKSDWYGALYYDVRPCKIKNQVCWMLLGLDYGNPLISKKIIDVLSFDDNGSPVFGKKWFEDEGKLVFRKVFEYSSTATMTVRFTSDTSVVFDHLVPIAPETKDSHQFFGPDYSYDSIVFKDGLWRFFLNVDVRNKQ